MESQQNQRVDEPIDLLARLAHHDRTAGDTRRHEPVPAKVTRWPLLAIALAAALSSLATYGLVGTGPTQTPAPAEAAPAAADAPAPLPAAADHAVMLEAFGYVVARNKASVSSDITGRIESIHVVVGQSIRKGDLIANLDDREARLRLTDAEIAIEQTRLAVENARVLAAHEQAKRSRLRDLVDRRFVSDAMYKDVIAAYDSAMIQLKVAQVNQADAQNNLGAARIFVERHVIRAPFDGVVVAVTAGPGETVSPTSSGASSFIRSGIVQLVDPGSLYVVAEVPERQIQPVHVGQQVEIVSKSNQADVLASTVTWVAPVSNRQRGVVEVGIDLAAGERRFIDGMELDVRFLTGPIGQRERIEGEIK